MPEVHAKIDCAGLLCPAPILMTEERLAAMKKGEVLEVLFTDLGAKPDLVAWCRATGNRVIEFKEEKWRSFGYIQKV